MNNRRIDEPGEPRGVHRQQREEERGRVRGGPIEQERPIRISAEQVRRSLLETEHSRSRTQVRKKLRLRHQPVSRDTRERDSVALVRERIWLSACLTIPVMMWGPTLPGILGFAPPAITGAQFIPAVSGTAVFAYGGWPFINGALGELKNRLPGAMTLIALALGTAFAFSVAVELGIRGSALWEELAALVMVVMAGHWIETRATGGIRPIVDKTQRSQSRTLADRASLVLTLGVIAAGAATLAWWLGVQHEDPGFAVERMVTVLVIACPQALAVAVPLMTAISAAVGARNGIVIRNRRAFDNARNLTTVVFDKTGTLTLGDHRVVDIATIEGLESDDALRLAAAVQRNSVHPIARAIRESAIERGLDIPSATDFRSVPGAGVKAAYDGREFAVGGPSLVHALDADPDHSLAAEEISVSARGQSLVYLIEDSRVIAAFAIADAIRPESHEAVKRLRRQGIEVVMMTEDTTFAARVVAKQLGIQRVLSHVAPDEKARRIDELRSLRQRVAMVGDGAHNAAALAAADVGVVMGAGAQVDVDAGDVVLVRSDPLDMARLVKLTRASHRKTIQNVWWAVGYSILAIPLGAGALAWYGVVLSPVVGAALMTASTIIMAINAQLLRRVRL